MFPCNHCDHKAFVFFLQKLKFYNLISVVTSQPAIISQLMGIFDVKTVAKMAVCFAKLECWKSFKHLETINA